MASDQKQILEEEKLLGRQVAKVATTYVRDKIQSSSLQLKGKGSPYKKSKEEQKPLLKATRIKPEIGDFRLLGFKFMSNRHGFVHHFGSIKDNTRFLQTHSKTGKVFQRSLGSLKSQSFFDDIYENSGALKMLEDGLSKTRTRAISIMLQNLVHKIELQNG
ncbi:hypothetical protein [Tenacibaculum sp. 47A_GOM-205m]|uniref:hypothetical protein n=1 Tax=Tenacibaculum sp. 47A_GOM-205m TaxID=1380384 RepID=UPI00048B3E9E|nr:hypothetical protein [Tenacibaculum sp. 47A_GOM-205m]